MPLGDEEARQLADIQAEVDAWPAKRRRAYVRGKPKTVTLKEGLIRMMLMSGKSAVECRNKMLEILATKEGLTTAIDPETGKRVAIPAEAYRGGPPH